MLIIAYCPTNDSTTQSGQGAPADGQWETYQYFVAALSGAFSVLPVKGDIETLERIYRKSLKRDPASVCLFFSPPDEIPDGIFIPAICVVDWNSNALPLAEKRDLGRQQERSVAVITHSRYSASGLLHWLGKDVPVVCVPTPVWDDFRQYRKEKTDSKKSFAIAFQGVLMDSNAMDLEAFSPQSWKSALSDFMASVSKSAQNHLSINGVVYLAELTKDDVKNNWQDLVRAFCRQFKKESNVNLVLVIRDGDGKSFFPFFLRELYRLSGFSCRVLVVQGDIGTQAYGTLLENSDFVVDASHGRGQSLALMAAMSAGIPAISPDHSAMGDYVDRDTAFVVQSSMAPAFRPHGPKRRLDTSAYRLDWRQLCAAFQESHRMIVERPDDYWQMSASAAGKMAAYCSREVVIRRFHRLLKEREDEITALNRSWRFRPHGRKERIWLRFRQWGRRLVLPKNP